MIDIDQDAVISSFKEWLKPSGHLLDETWELGMKLMTIRSVDKGTVLLRRGQSETHFRFIYSGIVKREYHVGDSSFVNDFTVDLGSFCETKSLITGGSNEHTSFTAITSTILIEYKREDIVYYMKRRNDFQRIIISIANQYHFDMMHTMSKYRLLNAEDRYLYLMNNYPSIIQHAKLSDVASYLNMIPSSLSRIRKADAVKCQLG